MKKYIFVFLSLLISCEVFAQAGGFPSRPKFSGATVAGVDITPSTGTFNANVVNGCSTTPSVTVTYVKFGRLVFTSWPNFSCTGIAGTDIRYNFSGATPTTMLPSSGSEISAGAVACGDNSATNNGLCYPKMTAISRYIDFYRNGTQSVGTAGPRLISAFSAVWYTN